MIPTNENFYGDSTRWFIGNVISINDPLELGRVKIRIFGVHTGNIDDIPEEDLPWAQVVTPTTEGGSSGIGANTGIKPMAQIFGIFLDGKNSQIPLVVGSIPKYETNRNPIDVTKAAVATLTGNTNVEKAYNFFLSKAGGEFTPEQVCGIIGNLMVESGANANRGDLNPLAFNEPEGSFGIAQWNPSKNAGNRLGALQDFCRERNYNYRELEPQLEFIKHELYSYSYFGLGLLRKTKTVEQASRVFEEYYERPAPGSTKNRVSFGEEILEKMET